LKGFAHTSTVYGKLVGNARDVFVDAGACKYEDVLGAPSASKYIAMSVVSCTTTWSIKTVAPDVKGVNFNVWLFEVA
jgi:hypothetical protein